MDRYVPRSPPPTTNEPQAVTDVNPLSSKQRAYLRSLAHKLDPVVHIGTGGVTDAVVTSVEETLTSRELLKVRVLDGAPEDTKATARQLEARMADVQVPLTTGRTFVLYRAFAEEPEIKLP